MKLPLTVKPFILLILLAAIGSCVTTQHVVKYSRHHRRVVIQEESKPTPTPHEPMMVSRDTYMVHPDGRWEWLPLDTPVTPTPPPKPTPSPRATRAEAF